MICVSFEDMSTLYRVALYADVKDTSFWDVFLKKLGIFLARNQIPFNYMLIVAQFLAHKPVNFVWLIFEFHCIIFKITETLILNANAANMKQLSGYEKSKTLPGLSRNGILV